MSNIGPLVVSLMSGVVPDEEPKTRNSIFKTLAVISIGLFMFLSGCGKEGPPLPPEIRVAERTKDLTAFQEGMAVHGRYKQPCPDCGAPVQRIRYASNETNYCPTCQTGGKLLADRAMSRLLKKDWPRTLEELELRQQKLTGDTL